jgi:hypothetical protein
MKPELVRRLGAVETALGGTEEFALILGWFDDSHEAIDEKLARWRSGEDIPGAPNDIVDRTNARVMIVFGVSPEHYANCPICQAKNSRKPG